MADGDDTAGALAILIAVGRVRLDELLQLHGGYGYMMEYPIARAYADARVQRIYGGTNEIMKEIIGRSLVGR
jgi:alkylation response protein AidB-like acyl-CoA dehydrogenase